MFVEFPILKPDCHRDRIFQEVVERGVPFSFGSCPEAYLEIAFDDTGWCPQERLPVARELGEKSLVFLVHPGLTELEIDKTVKVIAEVMELATT